MSRLESNSKSIRNQLISRNSYNPSDIYDINNSTVVDIINTTSSIVRPGNGFDFSNTVIGRIVGPNTPIAVIGNKALANLYTSQVTSTLVRKNVPTINLNNLFNGKSIVEKNIDYSITKENPNTIQEKIFNAIRYSSGINRISNPIPTDVTQEDLITKFTGKGQLNILSELLSSNIYSNDFKGLLSIDNKSITNITERKSDISSLSNTGIIVNYNNEYLKKYYTEKYSSRFYATSGNSINQKQINEEFGITYKIDEIKDQDIISANKNTFTWGDNIESKGLLGYTNALFNTLNTNNNAPFNKKIDKITVNNKIYYNGNQYRQSNVNNQYDGVSNAIRSKGNGKKNSVIKDSIIPQFIFKNDNEDTSTINTVMFSIENLAIDSSTIKENNYGVGFKNQIGPNKGRIMWFMPSILDFTEDVSPNISSTNFLGRGEPVYTYANTERKLTISFYMVVDYVKEFINVNSFTDFQNKIYNINQQFDSEQINKISTILNEDLKLRRDKELTKEIDKNLNKPAPFSYNNLPINLYYEYGGLDILIDNIYNESFEDNINNLFNTIVQSLNENPNQNFEINIKSTVYDPLPENANLVEFYYSRSNAFKSYLETYINYVYPNIKSNITISIQEPLLNSLIISDQNESIISFESISKRFSSITSVLSIPLDESQILNISENISQDIIDSITKERINNPQFDKQTNNTTNQELKDYTVDTNGSFSKIQTKTIQNGFMSYTPEDLYDRLTFLHQCTRQGRTQLSDDNRISNSVFGRPPVIVFKLGDMYNTKAMITSLNLSFENDLPWDLNPEGFGVQKMGCKVTMNMNLIGGSTVDGPKSHILNGESRRFYANSSYEDIAKKSGDILDREETK
jgi:hypothetical protein